MYMKKYFILFFGVLVVTAFLTKGQDKVLPIPVKALILGEDTLPLIDLPEVEVWTFWGKVIHSNKIFVEWSRTKYNVKKVYPYAILASVILKEMDNKLAQIPSEKERKKFIKQCEKELRAKFEEDLKNLSVTQGRILMKLIYRETGKTTYQIVKEMRGGFEAAMWQALAFIFGNSMKVTYEPNGEDYMVEKAVQLVEKGYF